jgi:lysophospholipase L1-like esterase
MKRLLLLFILLPCLALADVNLATAPISRMDLPWWATRFHQTRQAAKTDPNAQVIWLGDSITQFWQRQGTLGYDNILPVWDKYYAPYHALDFGFVGDTTANLIWRIDHGQLDGLHPKLAIILIGANNFGAVHWDTAKTVPGIESVVSLTAQHLPGTHILLLGVLPSIRSAWVDAQTRTTNAALRAHYADSPTVTFDDVSPVLETDGHTDAALYIDPREVPPRPPLHPDAAGMSRIAATLSPLVSRFTQEHIATNNPAPRAQ